MQAGMHTHTHTHTHTHQKTPSPKKAFLGHYETFHRDMPRIRRHGKLHSPLAVHTLQQLTALKFAPKFVYRILGFYSGQDD